MFVRCVNQTLDVKKTNTELKDNALPKTFLEEVVSAGVRYGRFLWINRFMPAPSYSLEELIAVLAIWQSWVFLCFYLKKINKQKMFVYLF